MPWPRFGACKRAGWRREAILADGMVESQLVVRQETRGVSKWEELVHTRQFSYERQAKDLQDTELGRVRSEKKTKDLQNGFLHGKVR